MILPSMATHPKYVSSYLKALRCCFLPFFLKKGLKVWLNMGWRIVLEEFEGGFIMIKIQCVKSSKNHKIILACERKRVPENMINSVVTLDNLKL